MPTPTSRCPSACLCLSLPDFSPRLRKQGPSRTRVSNFYALVELPCVPLFRLSLCAPSPLPPHPVPETASPTTGPRDGIRIRVRKTAKFGAHALRWGHARHLRACPPWHAGAGRSVFTEYQAAVVHVDHGPFSVCLRAGNVEYYVLVCICVECTGRTQSAGALHRCSDASSTLLRITTPRRGGTEPHTPIADGAPQAAGLNQCSPPTRQTAADWHSPATTPAHNNFSPTAGARPNGLGTCSVVAAGGLPSICLYFLIPFTRSP